ncbi:MAG: NAD-dependent epimerase/dehydratase family protein [bacterium]|nr:NAD-dependent epimerase/dehydratase family protein [bacterium]
MKALVTGGGGFLGGAIVRQLHARSHRVIALGRNRYPDLERIGIATIQADIRDAEALRTACAGVDVVLHVAALPGIWGKRRDFWTINVDGTRNVIDACRRAGVRRLVYTSSPSVIFGEDPLCGVDESQPYPGRYLADYPETKAVAERSVLEANGPNLATVALRPHLIWGPGDPHLIPRIVDRARRGRLAQVGDGTNLVDITYIDNAAAAHLLAADALLESPERCGGRAYFVSQAEPVAIWPWINTLLERLGVPPVQRRVSYATARRAGWLCEQVYKVLRISAEPPMTRFLASQLAKSHYFNTSAAHRDLGYEPVVSTATGLDRLTAWYGGANRRPSEAATEEAGAEPAGGVVSSMGQAQ